MKYYVLAQENKMFLLLHLLFYYYQIGFLQKKKAALQVLNTQSLEKQNN